MSYGEVAAGTLTGEFVRGPWSRKRSTIITEYGCHLAGNKLWEHSDPNGSTLSS